MFKKKQKEEYKKELDQCFSDGQLSSEEVNKLHGLQASLKLKDKHVQQFHISHLKNVFESRFRDHVITPEDREHLSYICKELHVPETILSTIYVNAFQESFDEAMSDNRITPEEEKALAILRRELGINDDQFSAVIKNRAAEYQIFKTLYEIEAGRLPDIDSPGYVKKKGEIIHYIVPNASMFMDKIKTSYQGMSHGVSIRIAKGVSYRVGTHKGNIIKTEATEKVDSGDLIITNQRILFSGSRKNQVSLIKNMINFQLYSDAIRFSVSNRQQISQYGFNPIYGELVGLIMSKVIDQQ